MATSGQKYFHKLNFVTRKVFYLPHLDYSLTDSICSLWIFHYLALLCIILHHVAFDLVIHCSTFSHYAVWLMYSFPPAKTPGVLINCSLFELFIFVIFCSCYFIHTIFLLLIDKLYCNVFFFSATRFHLSCVIFTSTTFWLQFFLSYSQTSFLNSTTIILYHICLHITLIHLGVFATCFHVELTSRHCPQHLPR